MTVTIKKKKQPDFLVNPYDYLTGFDDEYIAHTNLGIGFLLTRPFLDKIEIFGDPERTEEEEARLYKLEKLSSDGLPRITENKKNIPAKSKYKKHYKVVLDENGTQLDLFFENYDVKNSSSYNYRFMKLVFNPWKSGISGVEKIRKFYNIILPSSDFDKILSEKSSVRKVDFAVDMIGIDIVALAINTNPDYKLKIFQTTDGKISSAYTFKSKKNFSSVKFYNKAQEIFDKSEKVVEHRYGKLLDIGIPITRIEKSRVFEAHKNTKSIEDLACTQNPFKFSVGWIEDKIQNVNINFQADGINELWRAFLGNVCHAGLDKALDKLDEKNRIKFAQEFHSKRHNLFSYYNNTTNWQEQFKLYMDNSGLLKKCN